MSFLYGVVLLVTIVWLLKKKEVYNPYDESLSGSGYFQSAYIQKEACTDEIYQVLCQLSGYKKIIKNFVFEREVLQGRKKKRRIKAVRETGELLLIHEAGVFVINSANIPGNITGNIQGRYWVQSFRDNFWNGSINYIANPFMENKKITDLIRWHCRELQKLQFYSFAVFGKNCCLQTEGYLDENKWCTSIQNFPVLIADVVRMKRRFLRPDEVDMIFDRLQNENCFF